ncbi:TPA: hypothetical protein QCI25_004488 [Enterobacter ludwigii]|nr:hypothetical protein [Enterobacter ludwigii]
MQKQTFSAEALGNEYATGVSRPAVLTTKAFLPHQRVKTEDWTMNDKGLKQWQLDNIWEGLRNQSSRNHRRVMKKMRAKQSKQAA